MKTISIAVLLIPVLGACISADDDDDSGDALSVVEADLAAGCTAARPTSVGGAIVGYPDNYSVNAAVGVELLDAQGLPVDAAGTRCSVALHNCNGASNYALFIRVNPNTSALGVPATVAGQTRSWSQCVSSKATHMYLEGYPRNPSNVTDLTKYAETMSNAIALTAGSTVRYNMRFPMRYEYSTSGNTGNVNGWAKCHGQPTPVTRLNAWTQEPSTACGIRAYRSGGTTGAANGYWNIGPLAAGQCGAASQPVGIVAHVTCDGVDMHQTKQIGVVRGKTIGAVNFLFP